MSDAPASQLVSAARRLVADSAAVLPPAHGVPDPDAENAADAVRVVSAGLLSVLRGDVRGRRRAQTIALLERADGLEGRFQVGAREAVARRADEFEQGLRAFRECTSIEELLDRLAPIMRDACGAERVVLGIVDDGAWTPLRAADRSSGQIPVESLDEPTPMAELPAERAAFNAGRPIVIEAVGPAGGGRVRPASVITPTFVGGRARGLFLAEYPGSRPTSEDVASVERMGRALGHAFEMIEMHERLVSLGRTVERLRETVGGRAPGDLDSGGAGALGRTSPGATGRPGHGTVPGEHPSEDLTPRQRQTLDLMLLGLSNAQIAERLVVGVPTVKSHVSAILRALGAVNRAEAIGRFLERESTESDR